MIEVDGSLKRRLGGWLVVTVGVLGLAPLLLSPRPKPHEGVMALEDAAQVLPQVAQGRAPFLALFWAVASCQGPGLRPGPSS